MRPYVNGYSAPEEGFVFTPFDWRNRKLDGYTVATETGTVPGAENDYTVILNERIVPNGTLVVTCGGDTLTVIPYGSGSVGVGQAMVSYDLPLVKVHSSREDETLSVQSLQGGGVLDASLMNLMQQALVQASSRPPEIFSLFFPGVPSGAGGYVLQRFVVPGRGNSERKIRRVTVSARDTGLLTSLSYFTYQDGGANGGPLPVELPFEPGIWAWQSAECDLPIDTSAGNAEVSISIEDNGGHGDIQFIIEVV